MNKEEKIGCKSRFSVGRVWRSAEKDIGFFLWRRNCHSWKFPQKEKERKKKLDSPFPNMLRSVCVTCHFYVFLSLCIVVFVIFYCIGGASDRKNMHCCIYLLLFLLDWWCKWWKEYEEYAVLYLLFFVIFIVVVMQVIERIGIVVYFFSFGDASDRENIIILDVILVPEE